MEHTEDDHHTEEAVIEAPLAKPRKKMTYTPEQLERKRESMKKAREFRNISYKEENKTLEKKLEEKDKSEEKVEEEPEEPVKKTVIKTRPKPKQKKRIVYEEEEEEDEEEYEEVIVRRRPKNIPKQKQYIERPDLVEETYKEKLQKQLQDERRRQVMAELFDF